MVNKLVSFFSVRHSSCLARQIEYGAHWPLGQPCSLERVGDIFCRDLPRLVVWSRRTPALSMPLCPSAPLEGRRSQPCLPRCPHTFSPGLGCYDLRSRGKRALAFSRAPAQRPQLRRGLDMLLSRAVSLTSPAWEHLAPVVFLVLTWPSAVFQGLQLGLHHASLPSLSPAASSLSPF